MPSAQYPGTSDPGTAPGGTSDPGTAPGTLAGEKTLWWVVVHECVCVWLSENVCACLHMRACCVQLHMYAGIVALLVCTHMYLCVHFMHVWLGTCVYIAMPMCVHACVSVYAWNRIHPGHVGLENRHGQAHRWAGARTLRQDSFPGQGTLDTSGLNRE